MQSGRDVVPREHLVGGAVAGDVPVGIEALGRHGVEPAVELEVLAPLLERAARPPDPLDHRADPAVAPAHDALGERRLGVVPAQLGAGLAQRRRAGARPCGAAPRREFWPNHWNGVCGFGHEAADRHRGARALRVLLADRHDVLRQLGDAERVVVGLGRQAGEEVELHPPPALRERGVDRGVEVLLGDQLVDHLAHPPRAGLGREREAGAAHLLDLASRRRR